MNLRTSEAKDRPEILRMAAAFLGPDGPYHGRFVPDAAAVDRLYTRMQQPDALRLVLEGDGGQLRGMFGAFLFEHPITAQIVCSEICWWVDEAARGSRLAVKMLYDGEEWATAKGAAWMEMIAPNERVAYFYERLGYLRTDIHCVKVL